MGTPDRDAGMWLLDRCHTSGGFFAAPAAPVPDLLSTATALHALSAMHVPLGGVRRAVPRFRRLALDQSRRLLRHMGGDAADCEYTYYALLALGHLSLDPS